MNLISSLILPVIVLDVSPIIDKNNLVFEDNNNNSSHFVLYSSEFGVESYKSLPRGRGLVFLNTTSGDCFVNRREVGFSSVRPFNADTPLSSLEILDSNENGIIDSDDQIYDYISVWIDINGNGSCDYGEVYSFKELDIELILEGKDRQYRNSQTHTILETFSYRMDGYTDQEFDAWGINFKPL
ncbi:hypothetical protein CWE13_10415 [Aliidiomarina shirensis]|uniref:EF-hand domain-containing protein n=1 Tax=Aliidiomarina shirensis TaxID=1048642 RepID=A0A432WQB0_9GAMM|nr:hypothetical protein [Aliidiomarina shirensis]RUO35951.1 hypothetical protein CWE13_10415 [Aliidiomarina shirensis]